MKACCKVKVKNPQGLHARPASMIVKLLQGYESYVHFTYKQVTVNAKSILSLLMLAAAKNAQILIEAEGEDAQEVVASLSSAFERQFEEIT